MHFTHCTHYYLPVCRLAGQQALRQIGHRRHLQLAFASAKLCDTKANKLLRDTGFPLHFL